MAWEATCEPSHMPCVINGSIGRRGDGYKTRHMDANDAEAYQGEQSGSFVEGGADMLTAFTITNINEAIGIARAANRQNIPCAISFTVETNGRLVKGDTAAGDRNRRSHTELNESETLDAGDPQNLGRRYLGLRTAFPTLTSGRPNDPLTVLNVKSLDNYCRDRDREDNCHSCLPIRDGARESDTA